MIKPSQASSNEAAGEGAGAGSRSGKNGRREYHKAKIDRSLAIKDNGAKCKKVKSVRGYRSACAYVCEACPANTLACLLSFSLLHFMIEPRCVLSVGVVVFICIRIPKFGAVYSAPPISPGTTTSPPSSSSINIVNRPTSQSKKKENENDSVQSERISLR